MVSRLIIAMALAATLSGCGVRQEYLLGTEAAAVSVCAPNGGIEAIKIWSGQTTEGAWRSRVKIYCKNNMIEALLIGEAPNLDTMASFRESRNDS